MSPRRAWWISPIRLTRPVLIAIVLLALAVAVAAAIVLGLPGLRVSVVKHAHHKFDIDHPGKDTYRHREAGAFEVVVASNQRLALMREFERPAELTVHQLIAALYGELPLALRPADGPRVVAVNATGGTSLVLEVTDGAGAEIVSIVDHRGRPVDGHPRHLAPGLTRLQVPRSGLVELAVS